MSITPTLLASEVPTPVGDDTFFNLALAQEGEGPTTINANALTFGMSINVPGDLNQNFAAIDIALRHGAGAFGLAYGLALSAAGLVVSVGSGQYQMGGVVQVTSVLNKAIAEGVTRAFLWILPGVDMVHPVLDYTTTPNKPAGAGRCGFLGTLDVSGGVITIDQSGVVFLVDGLACRWTADPGRPSDTPGSNRAFYTRTLGGWYLWTGETYIKLSPAADVITKTDGYQILNADSGSIFTNTDAPNKIYFTLPLAGPSPSGPFEFIVDDEDGLRIVAGEGDVIRFGTSPQTYVESVEVGAGARIVWLRTGFWQCTSLRGTWHPGVFLA